MNTQAPPPERQQQRETQVPDRKPEPPRLVRLLLRTFGALHFGMSLLFAAAGLALIVLAVRLGWETLSGGLGEDSADGMLQAVGLLAAAVVAVQIAQTILEEEVVRDAHIGAPTRVRRFLSRFMVVIVVALAIEGLVATFKASRDDLAQLPYAAALFVATGVLLAGWGLFIRFNREAEELEPQAMQEAMHEDQKLR